MKGINYDLEKENLRVAQTRFKYGRILGKK